ncbi:hypothetical protein P154DRAFT_539366 [Amniculicola lignicola CBS 123094]|uniref:DUF7053 domain-containing protein n=1 Tax=Amniculicola lignicola CBS 123094 TaxID=1392246 RepID=A0A6A5VYB4_9PLEO|nr:hypothetical protein P154DRAFT_539366 [Amniculicola lignicola CBS 123094]
MSFFNTSATLYHITPLPSTTTRDTAITTLQNHDSLIRLDPDLSHYEALPTDPAAPDAKRYKVTDSMQLPKAVSSVIGQGVSFESVITDKADGVEWVIKAPLGLVQTSQWTVKNVKDLDAKKVKQVKEAKRKAGETDVEGEWWLVEDVEIKASRLLMGTAKGKCEGNYGKIHGRFVGYLTEKKDAVNTVPATQQIAV